MLSANVNFLEPACHHIKKKKIVIMSNVFLYQIPIITEYSLFKSCNGQKPNFGLFWLKDLHYYMNMKTSNVN